MATKKKAEIKNITASYDTGIKYKVPYSFFGSIYDADERRMIAEALKQDTLTMGPQVVEFENEFARMCGGGVFARAVSNCTTGMHVATQVMGLGKGDEVIVTPNTFIATTLVLLKEGVRPVYADINPHTYNIDPAQIAKKITKRTKAIYVVHYGGLCCDMEPIVKLARKRGLYVLEDCAHAPGAKVRFANGKWMTAGAIGDIASFSFHSLKNMTTCGEGGMITTTHQDWVPAIEALRCMNLKHWPGQKDYWIPSHFDVDDVNGRWGCNYRMNEIQAASGRAQLRKLAKLNDLRRKIGFALIKGLAGVEGITCASEPSGYRHVFHLFTVCVGKELGCSRDDFLRILAYEEGVQGILHYQPTYHFTGLKKLGITGRCPNAEEFFYRREFNIPMHPRLTMKDVRTMVRAIANTVRKVKAGHRYAPGA
ncbi:MAG: DegT/DnrJ/EryC1/StrS family aminotransferase [Planctomycetota bacterium]